MIQPIEIADEVENAWKTSDVELPNTHFITLLQLLYHYYDNSGLTSSSAISPRKKWLKFVIVLIH